MANDLFIALALNLIEILQPKKVLHDFLIDLLPNHLNLTLNFNQCLHPKQIAFLPLTCPKYLRQTVHTSAFCMNLLGHDKFSNKILVHCVIFLPSYFSQLLLSSSKATYRSHQYYESKVLTNTKVT